MNGSYHINVVKRGSSRVNLKYVYNLPRELQKFLNRRESG